MLDLLRRLETTPSPRMLVVGDVMLDRYTWGDADRISPEAPILVLRADESEVRLGGAASVALLARALGASVELVGLIGDDGDGRTVRRLLDDGAIGQCGVLFDPSRLTTSKERLIGRAEHRHSHPILRVDRECREAPPADLEAELTRIVLELLGTSDVLLISDYGKGVCTPMLLEAVISAARQLAKPVLVDPARYRDFEYYRGASLLKPNRVEAEQGSGLCIQTVQEAAEAATRLRSRYSIESVVITLDRQGLVWATGGRTEHVPARPRELYDITGAGDMSLAALGFAIGKGEPLSTAAGFANFAAGLEVERQGVAPVPWSDLVAACTPTQRSRGKVLELSDLLGRVAQHRRQGRRIVFTNGCFDLLHIGHVTYLEEARQRGDVLIVAVNSDASVRQLKGPDRPVIGQHDRAAMLAGLGCVDYVTIFEELTPHRLLQVIRPDVLVKGGTYSADEVVGKEVVHSYGGQVEVLTCVDAVSTTRILKLCRTGNPGAPHENHPL